MHTIFIRLDHATKAQQTQLEKLTKGCTVNYVADKGVEIVITAAQVQAIRTAGLFWLCDEVEA